MCQQASETLDHIVLGCVFSQEVWNRLFSRLHLQDLAAGSDLDLFVWWSRARLRVPRMSRKGFNSLVAQTCWSLWKERNTRTFRGEASLAADLVTSISQEAELWVRSGFACLSSLLVMM
jgi:hypothetical protein